MTDLHPLYVNGGGLLTKLQDELRVKPRNWKVEP